MNNNYIGYFDFQREPVNKRNARRIYLAVFLAIAVGGLTMAFYAYQINSQPLGYDADLENGIQTTGLGLPSITGTDETLSILERCCLGAFDTEQGSITLIDGYVDYPLPLHINDEAVSDWYLVFAVHGGYEPWDGGILMWQKGELAGLLVAEWTYLGYQDCHDYWMVTFTVCEPFTLDSNQYPFVDSLCYLLDDVTEEGTIPGKEVWLDLWTFWTGCEPGNDQDFTVISAVGALVLENSSPFPQLKIDL